MNPIIKIFLCLILVDYDEDSDRDPTYQWTSESSSDLESEDVSKRTQNSS